MLKKYLLSHKKSLYSILVGFITKNGNKSQATKIVNSAFLKVSKKTGLSKRQILLKLFLKLNSFVEVRKLKIRKRIFFVPFPTTLKRRLYLELIGIMKGSEYRVEESIKDDPVVMKAKEILQDPIAYTSSFIPDEETEIISN